MTRIGTDHLAREAIVYVRQSTIGQVINNSKAAGDNMPSWSAPDNSAGPMSA